MQRRALNFQSYDEILAEIERLEQVGYQRVGAWNLGRICFHLSYYLRGSLDGFGFQLPWVIRKLLVVRMLHRLLDRREMKAGSRTIPKSLPPDDLDEITAVAEARGLLARLQLSTGPLQPSPLFGPTTVEQWRHLHTLHAAHHLSFLIPGGQS